MTATDLRSPLIAQAVAYFVSVGWSPAQAAGLVANLWAESRLRPDAVGDGGAAYGIAQWHPDRQQRFAAIFGKSIVGSSLEEQLAFVHAELGGAEHAAGDALRACVTAAEAGACVSKKYERPADREGEAAKRAVLAAEIAGEQPAAPIEDHSMPAAPATASQEGSMPFLATLLPMVLQLFAPRAQAELAKVSGNAPAAQALVTELVSQGGKLLNIPTDAQPTNEQGVAVVAALQKAKADNAELVAQLEQHALDYLDKLAPLFDRLQKADEWQRQAELAGRREAAERHVEAERDVVRVVVKEVNGTSRWMLFGVAAGILAAIVARALVKDLPDYVTPLIALAGPLFGQVMKERGAIVAYYFDGTPTSNAAAAINAQIAKVDAQRTGGSQ